MKGGEKVRRAPGFIPRTIFFWLFMLFLYGPIAVIAILSFQGPQGGLTFPMTGFSLHWFKDVIDPTYIGDFRWPFGRSVILALIVMALTVLVSFLAGLAYRKGFMGGTVLFYLVITCLVAPSFLVSLGIGLGFANLEMQTQWWSGGLGAHLSWTVPIGVLIMLAVFARFDRSLEEAARDLGATEWQNLRNVVIPIMAPGMIAVGLFGFTLSYDEFPRTSLVTGTANTLPVEMVAVTGTAATPSLYAVGTMTTVFSLAVIVISFVAIYVVQARRAGRARSVQARYGKKPDASGSRFHAVGTPAGVAHDHGVLARRHRRDRIERGRDHVAAASSRSTRSRRAAPAAPDRSASALRQETRHRRQADEGVLAGTFAVSRGRPASARRPRRSRPGPSRPGAARLGHRLSADAGRARGPCAAAIGRVLRVAGDDLEPVGRNADGRRRDLRNHRLHALALLSRARGEEHVAARVEAHRRPVLGGDARAAHAVEREDRCRDRPPRREGSRAPPCAPRSPAEAFL